MRRRTVLSTLTSGAIVVAVAGCGGSSSGPVVVQVGDQVIRAPVVAHWAKTVSVGNAIGTSVGGSHVAPREAALSFLISAAWLVGEADARGVPIKETTVEKVLHERVDGLPGGEAEFRKELSSTAQTVSDVKLEIRSELAAARLRALVAGREAPVTEAGIAGYYREHNRTFRIPELRVADLIESIPSRSAAVALGRRLGSGSRFARKALREHVARETARQEAHEGNAELVRGIFAAAPGRVGAPVRFHRKWVLIVVRGMVPSKMKPLAQVKNEIADRLTRERHARAVAGFIKAYRHKWIARTNCSPGYVVQQCLQYRGVRSSEEDPFTGD